MSTAPPYDEDLRAAAALGRTGDFDGAIARLHRAIGAAPARFEGWALLGECEAAARRPEAALVAFDQAIARRPEAASLRCTKASVLRGMGHAAAAAELYAAARSLEPDCVEAVLGQAALASDAGRRDDAAALLAGVPPAARGRLDVRWATARLALARGDWALARGEATAILGHRDLSAAQAAEAHLLAGEAAGEQGDHRAAFAAAAAGKALLRNLYAGLAASREGEAARARRLARWWDGAGAAAWQPAPSLGAATPGAAGHAFILGFPRSGTTLLEQVLAGHPDVAALEEAPTLADHQAEFLADDAGCARLATLTAADADAWRRRYWASVAAHGVDADGSAVRRQGAGGYADAAGDRPAVPAARILFAVRDPARRRAQLPPHRVPDERDDLCLHDRWRRPRECYDACMTMAGGYRAVHAACPHRGPPRGAGRRLRQRDWRASPPSSAWRVEPAHARRRRDGGARDVRTPSARQVRAGFNRRGVGRWRAYAAELAPVLPTLAPWVAAFGYPAD